MLRGRYIGSMKNFSGKTALLQSGCNAETIIAQFDDKESCKYLVKNGTKWEEMNFGFGWHVFPRSDFELQAQSDEFNDMRFDEPYPKDIAQAGIVEIVGIKIDKVQ